MSMLKLSRGLLLVVFQDLGTWTIGNDSIAYNFIYSRWEGRGTLLFIYRKYWKVSLPILKVKIKFESKTVVGEEDCQMSGSSNK